MLLERAPLILSFLVFCGVAHAGELTYFGSNDPPAAPDQFVFTQWKAGDVVAVAVPDANLRKAASVDAPVVRTLPLGTEATVKSVAGAAQRVGKRVDRWYRVKVAGGPSGFLFGSTLTSEAFRFDFDDDGDEERVTVAWTSDFKIRVRVWEPHAPSDAALTGLTLQPSGQAFVCCGGTLKVERIDAATAGLPLLAVASSVEACADFGTIYVSYAAAEGGSAAGTLRKALAASGMTDPPTYGDFEVTFQPKKRGAKVVSRSWTEGDEEGVKQDLESFISEYRLKDGVFVEVAEKKP